MIRNLMMITFTFVPVDKKGVPLDDGKDAGTIESNYIHVDKNVYAVYNDDNVLMGYRERVKDDSGKYIWKVCNKPHIDDSVGNGLGSLAPDKDIRRVEMGLVPPMERINL